MPLPVPESGETKKSFISRCMGDVNLSDEYPDSKQRAAVCNSQWEQKMKTERSDRVELLAGAGSVDSTSKVIRGYVVAEAGDFKTGRGHFDQHSLERIAKLMNAHKDGVRSNYTHEGAMGFDGLGTFLGRARDARVDGTKVRADLHLDPSCFVSPRGNLGDYLLTLAASDPAACGSSLVLVARKTERKDKKGKPLRDADGNLAPPHWLPVDVISTDIVSEGDAVHSLLSAEPELEEEPNSSVILAKIRNRQRRRKANL